MVQLKNVSWGKIFLLLWFVINLGIGAVVVQQYGMSVDEPNNYRYAEDTLDAYPSFFGTLYEPKYRSSYDGHGPVFVMMVALLIRGIQILFPDVTVLYIWHFSYFIAFQLTALCLYWLTKRWFSQWTAWAILILFTTQPLLWGHAFINPKDIPFMFSFTLSIVLGLRLVDSMDVNESSVLLKKQMRTASDNFREKLKILSSEFFRTLKDPHTILAGIALGLATGIRSAAPLAGVIIFLYMFLKVQSRAWITSIVYFLIAGVSTYLSWPYLWKAPITNFLESLQTASNFPNRGLILFMGNLYTTDQLPRGFFPTLLSLQLTEPVLIFILIGFAVSLYLFIKGKNREPILLFAVWFLPLIFWIIFSHNALYDNARHLLFLWPSLFILAAIGIDQLMILIKSPLVRVVLVVAMVFPGVYASIQLHPYQYVYYNSLIGGVRGAYRNFELDYWSISFKESMDYLNQNAEAGATIVVVGPKPMAEQYVKHGLIISDPSLAESFQEQPYYVLSSTRANKDQSYCKDSEAIFIVERGGGVLSLVKKILSEQDCK